MASEGGGVGNDGTGATASAEDFDRVGLGTAGETGSPATGSPSAGRIPPVLTAASWVAGAPETSMNWAPT